MHPLIQIPLGTYAVLRRVTAECCFIVPMTPQFLQLNTCSSCPSIACDFFFPTSVYVVTVPTIKSFLTLPPARHSLLWLSIMFCDKSVYEALLLSVFFVFGFPRLVLTKNKKGICLCVVVQFRTSD
jgi:hypothetical protein